MPNSSIKRQHFREEKNKQPGGRDEEPAENKREPPVFGRESCGMQGSDRNRIDDEIIEHVRENVEEQIPVMLRRREGIVSKNRRKDRRESRRADELNEIDRYRKDGDSADHERP